MLRDSLTEKTHAANAIANPAILRECYLRFEILVRYIKKARRIYIYFFVTKKLKRKVCVSLALLLDKDPLLSYRRDVASDELSRLQSIQSRDLRVLYRQGQLRGDPAQAQTPSAQTTTTTTTTRLQDTRGD